ncbi:MAG: DNA ligase D [Arachidicoccus sp.]|nr:DNA ligase D [Arachidicoccus sp.]
MSLTVYNKKRSFTHTPEPKAGKSTDTLLRFVVQKHDASRLHYDFRLEMDGVLKSWAVPKGPSLNPADKRLAMMVEDHPYDYKDFEGIIPKGNYGAGKVIVWDEGTYYPIDGTENKKAQEKSLLQQLKAGSLKFFLNGKKLKGEFALVKTKGMAENSWLLIKHKDKFATTEDITKKDKSVISHKTVETIENKPQKNFGNAIKSVKKNHSKDVPDLEKILASAPKAVFPKTLSPMLATLVDAPFDSDKWEYEIKWDGYRALSFINGKTTEIRSRNNKSFNEKFYPVFEALKKWGIKAVIDGEIVVVNEKGISRFNKLQKWCSEADGLLQYYVFDILWYQGKSLLNLPLFERIEILKTIIPTENEIIRVGFSLTGRGKEFFATAQQLGLEGIIAKKLDSAYLPGERSRDWLKIKAAKRQEVIIIGYTHNEGSPKTFSALLLGIYNHGKLQYAGKVGTGFNDKMQKEMMKQFKPLIVKKSPLLIIPDYNKPSRFRPNPPHADAVWLKPKLVCEITFTEVTKDGVFRHPSFKGMREDKAAKDVIKENEQSTDLFTDEKNYAMKTKATKTTIKNPGAEKVVSKKDSTKKSILTPPAETARKTFLNPAEKTQVRKINGKEISFTNLDKIFWPEEKITKRDLLNYYYQIAPYILPYIKDRPQSLYRFPDGYKGKNFYQKDVTDKVPEWAETYLYHSEGDQEDKHFLIARDEASLLYMVNFGCIEINPWSSTVNKPDNPDWCLLDLDPGTKTTFDQVIDTAIAIHNLLESASIPSFPKTSGSTGMHIYIPLGKKYSYEQSKEFARVIVTLVQSETENFTTTERSINERQGKLYLDFLQNRPQATLAAPYSVRPKPKATVSMPLHWEEVKHGLKIQDFTLQNVPQLLEERGDIFKGVFGKGIDMVKVLKTLSNLK